MQSADYISTLLKSADALFLSETWLRPYQSQVISDVLSQHGFNMCDNVVFHKSGMINAPPDYTGRPYGGVSWVFDTNSSLSYREIECSSDRVIPVQVMCGKQHMQVLIGVYMPFYKSGDRQQTEEFIATLDAIQTVVDEYAQLGPVRLVRDLNVQLPRGRKLPKYWTAWKGFTPHSAIMYDFLITNNFVCVDFEYEQNLTYTYFQHETNVYTWINHILSNDEHSQSNQSITRCFIHDYNEHNMSDHLSLSFIVEYKFSACDNVTETCISRRRTPNWENFAVREKYSEQVRNEISKLPALHLESIIPNSNDALSIVNDRISAVNECILQVADGLCHNASFKQYKAKPFWCPELATLRNKKKFWWNLWVTNGRPRYGQIF